MIYGEVIGSLWASVQDPGFDGRALKLVVPADVRGGPSSGNTLLAVDLVGSREGDRVLVVYEGSSSRLCMGDPKTPCEAVIVAIVDTVDLGETLPGSKV